jgi:hypothetical protein
MTFTAWEFADYSSAPVNAAGIRLLNIAQDFQADIYVTRKNASTLATEPAIGLGTSTLYARWSATPNGVLIGSQSIGIEEVGSGAPGRYVGTYITTGGAGLAADLAAYVGKIVYLIVFNNLGTIADQMSTPYLVVNAVEMEAAP